MMVRMYLSLCLSVSLSLCLSVSLSLSLSLSHTHTHTNTNAHTNTLYIYIYACVCVFKIIYAHTHTHTHIYMRERKRDVHIGFIKFTPSMMYEQGTWRFKVRPNKNSNSVALWRLVNMTLGQLDVSPTTATEAPIYLNQPNVQPKCHLALQPPLCLTRLALILWYYLAPLSSLQVDFYSSAKCRFGQMPLRHFKE
jgi:hypothetical protein